ncbi:hypothetical protein B0T18DRAFT_451429 [Schizothecium vesticola]|uniref:Uncharacterized protein n=1 Tax=Schizothecium vesticola TaxID=314040 RepID=A0AA40F954_9PEZI|nr:hypothetical protein B0T18DRAFT_451429 [Schizothecium vesticola]
MKEAPDSSSTTDMVSAISSVIAVVFALVTVVTVYVAARQLLSERCEYQMGLSLDALGPWHTKIKTRRLLGLQQQIATPVISVQTLLKQDWNPDLTLPAGFAGLEDGSRIDSERAPAKASWVNFLQALGIQPADESLYRMHDQSVLVNGIILMRWAGKDLVSVGTILGFQSCDEEPNLRNPMRLPMQWHGPPGWLQFRQSPEGCVAIRLSRGLHEYYARLPRPSEPHLLRARLWWTVGAMLVREDKALFISGVDGRNRPRAEPTMMPEKEADPDSNRPHRLKPQKPDKATASNILFSNLMRSQNPGERTARWLETTQPGSGADDLHNGEPPYPWGPGPWGPWGKWRKEEGRMLVLYSSPGELYSVLEGELIASRGLHIKGCLEYCRIFVDHSKEAHEKFEYRLGDLYMDRTLLGLLKDAMTLLKAEGYYFTPNKKLAWDVDHILGHDNCFILPLDDVALFQKASYTLREKGHAHPDLVWAIVVCPKLYEDLADFFHKMECLSALGNFVSCTREVLDCTALMAANQTEDSEVMDNTREYSIPLYEDGRFSSSELLAAFIDLTVTAFWVNKRWISSVWAYDPLIPSTVTMC